MPVPVTGIFGFCGYLPTRERFDMPDPGISSQHFPLLSHLTTVKHPGAIVLCLQIK